MRVETLPQQARDVHLQSLMFASAAIVDDEVGFAPLARPLEGPIEAAPHEAAPTSDALVRKYASLVKRIAHHMVARLPSSVQVDGSMKGFGPPSLSFACFACMLYWAA